MSFENFFTIDQYMLFVDNIKDKSKEQEKNARDFFSAAMESYLKDLRNQGLLNSIDGFESMRLMHLSAWNRFANNQASESDWSTIMSLIGNQFTFRNMLNLDRKIQEFGFTDEIINSGYLDIIEQVNKGSFEPNRRDYCRITGNPFDFQFTNWTIGCGTFDDEYILVPLTLSESPSAKVNSISIETGNLLISDWFKIEEFNATVNDKSYTNDIGYMSGRDQEQARFAEQFNFISVNVGSSCPTIMEKDGFFTAANCGDERDFNEEYNIKGTVHTELWNVTIIEKENLIRIIALTTGHNKAVEIVDDYINQYDITEINVAPGTYYCYSSGDYANFGDYLSEYETPFSNIKDPLFIFGNRELTHRFQENHSDATDELEHGFGI